MITNLKLYPSLNHWGLEGLEVKICTPSGEFAAKTHHTQKEGSLASVSFRRAKPMFSAIRKHLMAKDEKRWREIDSFLLGLDGTGAFRKIGANLALAISLAAARAGTSNELWRIAEGRTVPLPAGRVVSGKQGGAPDWTEFIAIPQNASNPHRAIKTLVDFWGLAGEILKEKKMLIGKDMGHAWMTKLDSQRTLSLLKQISRDYDLRLGVNFGAHRLWDGGKYVYRKEGKTLSSEGHYNLVLETAKKFGLYYLEDPFHSSDIKSYEKLKKRLPKALIAGNQIYYSNIKGAAALMGKKPGNAAVLNPSNLGLLSTAERFALLAGKNQLSTICSGCYAEPSDHWLADLSVAFGSPLLKTGITGPDLLKHNRLIELWGSVPGVKMAELP
jgi:enolase